MNHFHKVIIILERISVTNFFNSFFDITDFRTVVHPCDKPIRGGCSQICIRKPLNEEEEDGKPYTCSCNAGYELEEDGVTCIKGRSAFNKLLREMKGDIVQ